MKLHMALEVILRLDVAQENRSLSPAELDLRTKLKKTGSRPGGHWEGKK